MCSGLGPKISSIGRRACAVNGNDKRGGMVGRYETQLYKVPVAGRVVQLLGPRYPHALNDEPEMRRRFEEDDYKPSWAYPWPPAVMLAEHVLQHVVPGSETMLELGAGLGLAGVALALAGHRVVVTDYDDDALTFVRANAQLNGVELADVRWLDWREPPTETYATIIGSDIVYERRHHVPIAELLAACLAPGGRAFISGLNRDVADAFPGALTSVGLSTQLFPAQSQAIPAFDAIDNRVLNGRVFEITRR